MESLKRLSAWSLEHSAGILFTLGLGAISIGCVCYDPPLGLIVPGAIVCSLTAIMHLIAFARGGS